MLNVSQKSPNLLGEQIVHQQSHSVKFCPRKIDRLVLFRSTYPS